MAFSDGQKMALYLLLSTDSEMRRYVEGRSPLAGAPHTPPANPGDISNRIKDQLMGNAALGVPALDASVRAADLNPALLGTLFAPGEPSGVTTSPHVILTALNSTYDPNLGPCPKGADQASVFNAIATSV
jgi:hypothetical protein